MARTCVSVSVAKRVWIEEEVELDANELLEGLDTEGKRTLTALLVPGAKCGDGDAERRENIIERAYVAALNTPQLPREIRDLFWLVHDRAL